MPVRVAINGLGRTGRAAFRAAHERGGPVRDRRRQRHDGPQLLAQLLRHDSVYGRFPGGVDLIAPDRLSAAGHEMRICHETDPAALPWRAEEVDVVIESTGLFRTRAQAAKHLEAGARKVVISAPAKGDEPPDATVALGVNFDEVYDPERHHVISNASCTTNCLAPVAKVLHEGSGSSTA